MPLRRAVVTYLKLQSSDKVRDSIHVFVRLLEVYDLRIVEQIEDEAKGIIELTITHCSFPVTRFVSATAQDIFGSAVLKFWFHD